MLTLGSLAGMIFFEMSPMKETTTTHFVLLLVAGYVMRVKPELLFSLSVSGIVVSVLGGNKISIPAITWWKFLTSEILFLKKSTSSRLECSSLFLNSTLKSNSFSKSSKKKTRSFMLARYATWW